jgi:hypothetical protein
VCPVATIWPHTIREQSTCGGCAHSLMPSGRILARLSSTPNAPAGSRGRRFKSGRPDQKVQVRRGAGFSLGPLFDLREPNGVT